MKKKSNKKRKSSKKYEKPIDSYLKKQVPILKKYQFGGIGNSQMNQQIFDAASNALMATTTDAVAGMLGTIMGKSNVPKVFDYSPNQNPIMANGGVINTDPIKNNFSTSTAKGGKIKKPETLNERLYRTVTPIGYDWKHALKEFQAGKRLPFTWDGEKTSFENFDKMDRWKDPETGEPGWYGEYIKKASDDHWNYYLNKKQKYNTFTPSKYRPTKSTGEDVEYMQFNQDDDIWDTAINQGMLDVEVGTNKLIKNSADGGFTLKDYTLSKGKDDKGHYISYYDKVDFAPTVMGMKLPVEKFVGNPYDFYGRMYYDPKTGKRVNPKEKQFSMENFLNPENVLKSTSKPQIDNLKNFKNGGVMGDPIKKLGDYTTSFHPKDMAYFERMQKKFPEAYEASRAKYLLPGTYSVGTETVFDDYTYDSPTGIEETITKDKYVIDTGDRTIPRTANRYGMYNFDIDTEASQINMPKLSQLDKRLFKKSLKQFANGGMVDTDPPRKKLGEYTARVSPQDQKFINRMQKKYGDEAMKEAGKHFMLPGKYQLGQEEVFKGSDFQSRTFMDPVNYTENLYSKPKYFATTPDVEYPQIFDEFGMPSYKVTEDKYIDVKPYNKKQMRQFFKKFAKGGVVNMPVAEVEDGEVYEKPNGEVGIFVGDKHGQDTDGDNFEGIPVTEQEVPKGTKIFSAQLGMAKKKLDREKEKKKQQEDLKENPTVFERNTYKRGEEIRKIEEQAHMNIQEAANMLDQGQQMANDMAIIKQKYGGLIKYANGGESGNNMFNALLGIGSNIFGGAVMGGYGATPKTSENEVPSNTMDRQMGEKDYFTKKFGNSDFLIPTTFGKGGMIPKYANGTSGLPPGFNPALLYQVPQFAKLAKEEQDRLLGSPEMLSQYVKKNVPSAFDKKMSNYADEIESAIAEYNIQSKPLNSGAYDSGLEMFGDQLFEVVPDNFRGISPMTPIQTKGLSNNLLNQYNASMQGPKSLYMDLSGIQGTTDVKPAYLDLSGVKGTTDVKPVNETYPEEYYTGPIEPEDEDVTKTILFDRYMGPIEPEDEDVTKTIQFNKDKITDESDTSGYDFTMGDMMGFAGTGVSGLGPLMTTLINRAGDTPNINPYLNYGKAGLAELEKMKGAFGTIRDENLRDIGLKSDTQRKRARSSARSVNTLRALEDLANAREQELTSDVYTKYAGQMAGISGNIAKAMDARDRMTMMGREKQDLADRQDRDNFFTQLNKDFGNMGKAMQKVGKDLNVKQLDKDFMNILPMMNKYGISVKKDKDGTFKMYNTSSGKFLSDKEQQDFYASLRKIREPKTDAKKYAEEEEQKKQQRRNEFYKRGNLVEQDVDYNTPDKKWNYLSGLNLFGN